ncbi:hypothetical protein AB0D78_27965 [Streptomyces avermitilis]|uniref:hypothetical protein n=1 Tax=Streptomyces avermitilis TaxID=33903 RepID=UPI0033FC1E53
MIEQSAVIYSPSTVADNAYVGHFSIVGHPRRIPPRSDATTDRIPWEASTGAHVAHHAVISSYCQIDDGSVIEAAVWMGSRCRVGHESRIRTGAQLYYSCQVYDRVDVGEGAVVAGFVCNDVRIGQKAQVFGTLVHRLVDAPPEGADPHPGESEPAPVVEEQAVVGVGAVVIGGVTVGRGAYIAAGAVLTKDAEPNTLYRGVPATAVGPAPSPFRRPT